MATENKHKTEIIAAFITIIPNLFETEKSNKVETVKSIIDEDEVAFMNKYYFDIKKVPYSTSWSKLSNSFIKNKNLSYDKYVSWWKHEVKSISIIDAQKVSDQKVSLKIKYVLNNKTVCSKDTF